MGGFSDFSSEIRIMKAKRSGPEIKNESKFVDIRTSLRCVLNLRVLPFRQQVYPGPELKILPWSLCDLNQQVWPVSDLKRR